MPLTALSKATSNIFAHGLRFEPNVESAIRQRYEIAFEDTWLDEASQLESSRLAARCPEIDAVCERAFKATNKQTESPELATLVADDFELFGTAIVSGHSTPFLCALWKSYTLGLFPTKASQEPGTLAKLIEASVGRA